MPKWKSLDIDKDLIIGINEGKWIKIHVPTDEGLVCFHPWKISKYSNKEWQLLWTEEFIFKCSKSKKNENGEWEKVLEKHFSVSEFRKLLNNAEFVSFTFHKNQVQSLKERVRVGFFTTEDTYLSFFVPKSLARPMDGGIYIRLEKKMPIETTITIDKDFKNATYEEISTEKLKDIFEEKENFNYFAKHRTPQRLKLPEDVTIDASLQNEDDYNETGALRTTTPLYKYQENAVLKMLPTRTGALFMDMGTGKTRTTLEIIRIRQNKFSKIFWITPVSLKYNIRREILKHTNLTLENISMFDFKSNEEVPKGKVIYIIGIESLGISDRVFMDAFNFTDESSFVIVDESSKIKGYTAKQTRRIIKLGAKAKYRLILTGTPISQGIVDLYSQFYFLSPKILGYKSFYNFADKHLKYSTKYPGRILSSHNEDFIAEKIKPYVYQIKKEECLDLPKKHYIDKYFEKSYAIEDAYQEAKEEFFTKLEESGYADLEYGLIFNLFNSLQQIVCGFRKKEDKIEEICNSRIMFLDSIVEEIPNEKIIIWAKYVHDIELITKTLEKHYGEHSYVAYYGQMSESEKDNAAAMFRIDKDIRFFVATLQSGSFGLTLTEARYAIFYNSSFKYIEKMQAEDRIHRIGQTQDVTYINILCDDSIDIKIDNAIWRKENVVTQFREEINAIKDKNIKKELLQSILVGDLKKAEELKQKDKKRSPTAMRMEKYRRARGSVSREVYLSRNTISKDKPWEAMGISRATWYRKNSPKLPLLRRLVR